MTTPRDVALFITCLTDQYYPRVGVAVTKILEHFGHTVHFPDSQTCCGQPFFNNGYHDDARDLAAKMIEDFAAYPCVVTPSGSCAAMVREHFPELFHGRPEEAGARELAGKTFEFVEFLTRVLKVDLRQYSLPERRSFTFHYNCHLRGLGIHEESIQLLQQLGNVEFRPMDKADQCCGFGGTFAMKYPEISGAIVRDKVACIARSGARTTLSNDAGCTMNIAGMLHRAGIPGEVTHIALVLAEAMGLDVEGW